MDDKQIRSEYFAALNEALRWRERKEYVEVLHSHAEQLARFITDGYGSKTITVVLNRMRRELKLANKLYASADKEFKLIDKAYKQHFANKEK